MNKNFLLKLLKSNLMLIAITIGIIIGFGIGLAFRLTSNESSEAVLWFKLPGLLFIRSLQLLILPVIFFGVITSTSSYNIKNNAKMSISCLLIAVLSIVSASIIGFIGSLSFKLFVTSELATESSSSSTTLVNTDRSVYDIISDFLRNLIPNNIVKATLYQELTQYVIVSNNGTLTKKRQINDLQSTNLLGILLFAIIIGISAGISEEKGEPFRSFVKSINQIFIQILGWIIKLAPVGIGSLIIDAVIQIKDFEETFKQVWIFAAVVILCCLFYSFCFQSLLVFLITKTNPFSYFLKFIDPIILAFASTSSAVCMSRSMDICEYNLKIKESVCRFSIPFFTTLKPDGSVIFITCSTIYLAISSNYTLSASDYVLIIVMTCTISLSIPPG
jgi:Na+/H+-dicarboxylate symporter